MLRGNYLIFKREKDGHEGCGSCKTGTRLPERLNESKRKRKGVDQRRVRRTSEWCRRCLKSFYKQDKVNAHI